MSWDQTLPGQEDSTGAEALSWLEQLEGTSWSHCVRMNWMQCCGCGSCARRVWGAAAGEWLRQGGREGGREAPALLYNFVADAVITGRAPPAWPVDGRQSHMQPPSLPGTLSHPWHPLLLLGHGRSLLCTPGAWSASGCRVPIQRVDWGALSLHPTIPQQCFQGAMPNPSEDAPASGGCPAPRPGCGVVEGAGGSRAVKPNPAGEQSRLLVSRTGRLIGTRELFA